MNDIQNPAWGHTFQLHDVLFLLRFLHQLARCSIADRVYLSATCALPIRLALNYNTYYWAAKSSLSFYDGDFNPKLCRRFDSMASSVKRVHQLQQTDLRKPVKQTEPPAKSGADLLAAIPTKSKLTIGRRLREERQQRGLTLADLAAASGITWYYIAQSKSDAATSAWTTCTCWPQAAA